MPEPDPFALAVQKNLRFSKLQLAVAEATAKRLTQTRGEGVDEADVIRAGLMEFGRGVLGDDGIAAIERELRAANGSGV